MPARILQREYSTSLIRILVLVLILILILVLLLELVPCLSPRWKSGNVQNLENLESEIWKIWESYSTTLIRVLVLILLLVPCLLPLEKVACDPLERGRSQDLSEHHPTSSTRKGPRRQNKRFNLCPPHSRSWGEKPVRGAVSTIHPLRRASPPFATRVQDFTDNSASIHLVLVRVRVLVLVLLLLVQVPCLFPLEKVACTSKTRSS